MKKGDSYEMTRIIAHGFHTCICVKLMRVCTVSCVTNMAAGMQKKISHDEVKDSSNDSAKNFALLISGLLSKMK